jgi:HNH endonuclease
MAAPDDLIEAEPADVPLPLDFGPDGLQDRICWYCGGGEGPFEAEHQLPVSRGGKWGANVVAACAACNHLKGRLTVDEFRRALAVRLGVPEVVFAGEAGEGGTATPITSIRSLGADREVVRVDPLAGDRLSRAVRFLRTMGRSSFTTKDAVTEAVQRWCNELAERYLAPGEDFPADGGAPSLFGDGGGEQPPILQPGELSSTPKVRLPRDVTRISGPVLERARRAVAVLRQREDPDLLLMGFVDAAVVRLVAEVETHYPELSRHADLAEHDTIAD